jgi:ferric hydroxamate transport system permease protein
MTHPISRRLPRRSGWFAILAVGFAALGLTGFNLHSEMDLVASRADPTVQALNSAILFYATLPRVVAAVLAGAGLAVSGMIFQDVLRNPIAEPSTLGVSSGAYLAVTLATVFIPGVPREGMLPIAMLGGGGAILVVLAFAWRQRLDVTAVALAGMTFNLVCGSLGSLIATFHRDGTVSMMFWGSGSLYQNDWAPVMTLAAGVLPATILLSILWRPISMFTLQDGAMRSLGLNVELARGFYLAIATFIAADVVAAVGMLGFVGLAAAWLVRLVKIKTVRLRLAASAAVGAALLLFADQLLFALGTFGRSIAVGTFTALVGAPLLLVMLARTTHTGSHPVSNHCIPPRGMEVNKAWLVTTIVIVLLAGALLSRDARGFFIPTPQDLATLLPWRWPRVVAAATAGGMLALSGCILQRLTGNDMASPEALGVSSGALLGGIIGALFPIGGPWSTIAGGSFGAAVVVAVVLVVGNRPALQSSYLIMTGIGLSTVLSAIVGVVGLYPDPRLQVVQIWMAGSTSNVSPLFAWTGLTTLLIASLVCACCCRWLDILPLGRPTAIALGINLRTVNVLLLAIIAVLSAMATLMIGPLSFAGLLAPHIARRVLRGSARPHLVGSCLVGATLMVVADAAGRLIAFPYEIPAGIVASIIGGLYMLRIFGKR